MDIREFTMGNLIVGVAKDIGPRVMKLTVKSRSGENLFGVLPDAGVNTPDGFWHIYGGHRLWVSPEFMPGSYSFDNTPVRVVERSGHISIYGNIEIQNNIQKEIEIRPAGDFSVEVVHRIKNIGRWPITLACWALSVMKQGGFAIVPVKAGVEGLLPDRHLTLWPYTDLSDDRFVLSKDFIFLKQDPSKKNPVKIGTMASPCWTAYWVDGLLFIKQFCQEAGEYPDFGCSVEVYTNSDNLELETLGSLKNLAPGATAEHTEVWTVEEIPFLSPVQCDIESKVKV